MKIKNKKRLVALIISLLIITASSVAVLAYQNKSIVLTEYTVSSTELPKNFQDFRILQVSDLHNDEFGKGNKKLISLMKDASPDIIVITGDIVDSYGPDIDIAKSFFKNASEIAPCYYVAGNHEGRNTAAFEDVAEYVEGLGITVLRNRSVSFEKNGESINIAGIDDPNFGISVNDSLLRISTDGYTILLSHRPENFDVYSDKGVDLVFCGHAHGGQFIIPLAGGIYAPGQGFFPEYYKGVYEDRTTSMVVSRGLGNSVFPLRVNNRPELVLVTLSREE